MAAGDPNVRRYPDYQGNRGGWDWLFLVFWFVVIVFICWGWWGGWWEWHGWNHPVNRNAAPAPNTGGPTARAPQPRTPEFLGRTVDVAGRVDHVYNSRAFTLAGESKGGQDLLVVVPSSLPAPKDLKVGQQVKVKGKVEQFQPGSFDRDHPDDLKGVPEGDFSGQAALLVSQVVHQENEKPSAK